MSAQPRTSPGDMKACAICGHMLPIAKFSPYGRNGAWRRKECHSCRNQQNRKEQGDDSDMDLVIAQRSLAFMDSIAGRLELLGISAPDCIGTIKETIWREPMLVKQLAAAQAEIARLKAQA